MTDNATDPLGECCPGAMHYGTEAERAAYAAGARSSLARVARLEAACRAAIACMNDGTPRSNGYASTTLRAALSESEAGNG